VDAHRELYNAALQKRRDAYRHPSKTRIARTIIRTSIAMSTTAGLDTGLGTADAGPAVRPVAAA
jgi:hypothetical protein